MKPTEVSITLRKIASAIDSSKNPDRTLVASDIRKVLAAMDEVALPKSNAGKSMLKDFLSKAEKALEAGDDEGFKSVIETLSKHANR